MSTATATNRVLRDALAFQARGWPVAPIHGPDSTRPTGCSCRDPECGSPAKHPTTRRGILDASTEDRLARIWWERHPGRGIALATGEPSGVWVLDLDGEAGKRSFLALREAHGRIPSTITSRTGGGGVHLVFRMPGDRDVRNSTGQVGDGIDVRGTGGYIVLPPSGHVSGRRYAWLRGRSPGEIEVADAPAWLLDLVAPPRRELAFPPPTSGHPKGSAYVRAAIEAECRELEGTPEGHRNDRLNVAAFNLARFIASGEADGPAVARALAYAAARAGLPEGEIRKTLRSAFEARGVA
jgi:hypothetical protein